MRHLKLAPSRNLAIDCLTFWTIGSIAPTSRQITVGGSSDFLEYSAIGWARLAKGVDGYKPFVQKAIKLLAGGDKRRLLTKVLLGMNLYPHCSPFLTDSKEDYQTSPLHIAAALGLQNLCRHLLKTSSFPFVDVWEQTPLVVAARYGHTEVVKVLLERRNLLDH